MNVDSVFTEQFDCTKEGASLMKALIEKYIPQCGENHSMYIEFDKVTMPVRSMGITTVESPVKGRVSLVISIHERGEDTCSTGRQLLEKRCETIRTEYMRLRMLTADIALLQGHNLIP
jgi:hypothetical protein